MSRNSEGRGKSRRQAEAKRPRTPPRTPHVAVLPPNMYNVAWHSLFLIAKKDHEENHGRTSVNKDSITFLKMEIYV